MNRLPLARTTDIVVQDVGKEILVYDLRTHKAYSLNETSSIVYQACDGETTFEQLRAKNKFTDEIIFLAIDELKKENLIENGEEYTFPFAGMSRREAIRKVGMASMIALPLISSLIVPTAAAAQSTCGTIGQTCSGSGAGGTCCSSLACVGDVCCANSGAACSTDTDCCGGNCAGGVCQDL